MSVFIIPADDMALCESLKDYILTDEKLIESNYPVQHPEKCGSAVLFAEKKVSPDGKWKYPTMLPGILYIISLEGVLD